MPFDRLPLILARVELDFRSPIAFGEEVTVETRVDRIGRTSFGMSHRMTAGAERRLVGDRAVRARHLRLRRGTPDAGTRRLAPADRRSMRDAPSTPMRPAGRAATVNDTTRSRWPNSTLRPAHPRRRHELRGRHPRRAARPVGRPHRARPARRHLPEPRLHPVEGAARDRRPAASGDRAGRRVRPGRPRGHQPRLRRAGEAARRGHRQARRRRRVPA